MMSDLLITDEFSSNIAHTRFNQIANDKKNSIYFNRSIDRDFDDILKEEFHDEIKNQYHYVGETFQSYLIERKDWKIYINRESNRHVSGTIAYDNIDDCETITELIENLFVAPEYKTETSVPVDFWYASANGPASVRKKIEVPHWDDIVDNYQPQTAQSLTRINNYRDGSEFPDGQLFLWQGKPGCGKAQPLDAKILTPTGWTTMGEVKVGDSIVGSDGKPTKVNGIYPQGIKEVCKVTFSDGSSTECCDEHLWAVSRGSQPSQNYPQRILPLLEIEKYFNSNTKSKRLNHYIPMPQPIEFTPQSLPLDPYLMGALLGDGCFRGTTPTFSNIDEDIINRVRIEIEALGLRMRKIEDSPDFALIGDGKSNILIDILRNLNFWGKYSYEKSVPQEYLWSSIRDRIDLLHGLMDTDGDVSASAANFNTTSIELVNAVKHIVSSLGGTTTISERITSYTHNNVKKNGILSYRVYVKLPIDIPSFYCKRKIQAGTIPTRNRGLPRRSIEKIEHIGSKPMQCISVDAKDRLYITDDFIVTHNTYALRALTKSWQDWCDFLYITDPDQFFGSSSYMLKVIFDESQSHQPSPPGEDKPKEKWKLLILEDAGEFLRHDARQAVGQALSRFLNVVDGMIGQGLKIIILVTTNEELEELHPAVSRPGRAVQQLQFKPLSSDEVANWIENKTGEAPAAFKPATLAELYQEISKKERDEFSKTAIGFAA